MAGTKAGAAKSVAAIKAKNPDHWKQIGHIGGSRKVTKGFGSNPELAREAGAVGGRISKRGKAVKEAAPAKKRRWSELVIGKAYKKQYEKKEVK